MHFPAEHLLDKLQISAAQLRDFEEKGIVHGVAKAGRVFYSSQDMYRLKGILVCMTRGLPLEEARWRVDHPTREVANSGNPGMGTEEHRDRANE
jgi:DNA-binding transcriptional MerR regulator